LPLALALLPAFISTSLPGVGDHFLYLIILAIDFLQFPKVKSFGFALLVWLNLCIIGGIGERIHADLCAFLTVT
jgi:hypothetical protein